MSSGHHSTPPLPEYDNQVETGAVYIPIPPIPPIPPMPPMPPIGGGPAGAASSAGRSVTMASAVIRSAATLWASTKAVRTT